MEETLDVNLKLTTIKKRTRKQIQTTAVMIIIRMSHYQVSQRHTISTEVVDKLPANEVSGTFLGPLIPICSARVHQVPLIVGCPDQNAITLSNVDYI